MLYVDFVYHQFPLIPYIYAPFSELGYFSYYLLRVISVFFTILLITLVYHNVARTSSNTNAAILAAILIISNAFFFDWNIVVKMYSFSNLLLYLSFFILTILKFDSSKKDLFYCFLIGLSSGICFNLRIMFAAPAAVILGFLCFMLIRKSENLGMRARYILASIMGISLASLPTLFYITNYYDYFVFGNFKVNYYAEQLKWSEGSNISRWVKFFLQPQNFILFVLCTIAYKNKFKYRYLLVSILISLFAANALGYLVNEYLTALIPFLVYIIGVNYEFLQRKFSFRNKQYFNALIVIYVLLFFVVLPHFRNKLEGKVLEPSLVSFQEIADFERTLQGKTILSSWDIYHLFSNKENILINSYISSCTGDKPTAVERNLYMLPSKEEIGELINQKRADVIVLNRNTPFALYGVQDKIIKNYNLSRTFGNIEIYTK